MNRPSALLMMLLCLLLVISVAACGEHPGDPTGVPNLSSVHITVDGIEFRCLIYDRKAGYAGMGGLWCERVNP